MQLQNDSQESFKNKKKLNFSSTNLTNYLPNLKNHQSSKSTTIFQQAISNGNLKNKFYQINFKDKNKTIHLPSHTRDATFLSQLDLNQYINFVGISIEEKEKNQQEFQQVYAQLKKEYQFNQKKRLLGNQYKEVQKEQFKSKQQKINEQNRQIFLQNDYNIKNQGKINELKDSINKLLSSVMLLQEYLQNTKKLNQILQRIMDYKPILIKLFYDEKTLISLNEKVLEKRLQSKTLITENDNNYCIVKYDFSVIQELDELKQKLDEIMVQNTIKELSQIQNSILNEEKKISKKEQEIHYLINCQSESNQYIQFQKNDLMLYNKYMYKYEPHELIEQIEKKHGRLSLISVGNRELSKTINNKLEILQKKL